MQSDSSRFVPLRGGHYLLGQSIAPTHVTLGILPNFQKLSGGIKKVDGQEGEGRKGGPVVYLYVDDLEAAAQVCLFLRAPPRPSVLPHPHFLSFCVQHSEFSSPTTFDDTIVAVTY